LAAVLLALVAVVLAAVLFALAAVEFEAVEFVLPVLATGLEIGLATVTGDEAGATLVFALLALTLTLVAPSPQAIPRTLRPRAAERAITFFILFKTPNLFLKVLHTCFQAPADRDTAVLRLSSFFLKANANIETENELVNLKIMKKWIFFQFFRAFAPGRKNLDQIVSNPIFSIWSFPPALLPRMPTAMQDSKAPARPDNLAQTSSRSIILMSLAALAFAYGLALVEFNAVGKTAAFAVLIGIYFAAVRLLQRQAVRLRRVRHERISKAEEAERAMALLDEACTVFRGSLGVSDAFRLVTNRIENICSPRSIRLYLLDESRTRLKVAHVSCDDARLIVGKTSEPGEGTAGSAYKAGQVVEEGDSVGIPLLNGANAFGAIELVDIGERRCGPELYDQIGLRCSELILSAIAKDLARDNALIDTTTELPNERAFRVVLENQAAEAQRDRGARALTVLAVDIRKFDELNQTYGHPAGDRVLRFAASTIKDNLRAMDFIARSRDDEFLVVLPTADAGTSLEIIERICNGFVGHKIVINDTQAREISLNIGAAAFGADGETPQQLIQIARLRKQESKSFSSARVIAFPNESSNLLN
jgi:diguanylate cyclase (GGDEF)-like protein